MSDQTDPAPDGAATFQGLLDLEVAYQEAAAAKRADPSDAAVDAHRAAMQAFADARSWWRRAAQYAQAQAFRDWLAEQPQDLQDEWAQIEAAAVARQAQVDELRSQLAALGGEG